jgi:cytochrome c biogenesis protein CcmG/thiol:disulfide interchange protein DsbE
MTMMTRMRSWTLIGLLAASMTAAVAGDGAGSTSTAGEFPADWFFKMRPKQKAKHDAMIGEPMPTLTLSHWIGDPQSAETMHGKVVIIDFWATWCGPCKRAIPHNNELYEKYADDGLVLIGVCGSSGQDKMPAVARQYKIAYPIARDAKLVSAKAWNVFFWPTYAAVDRSGIVRAIGLKPQSLDPVIRKLLAEPAPDDDASGDETIADAEGAPAIPSDWLEVGRRGRAHLAELHGAETPPALQVTGWINSEPLTLEKLKGKVVVLDFWATWCGPCLRSIPASNALAREYADEGLVFIGVCHPKGSERMAQTVKEREIAYPVAIDADGKTIEQYRVNGYPDYYIIDRQGRLRIADCANKSVREAVEYLLAEKAE